MLCLVYFCIFVSMDIYISILWRLEPCSICFWLAVDAIVCRCETFGQIKLLSLRMQPAHCDKGEDGGHSQVRRQPWCCSGSPGWTHATGPSSIPGQLLVVSRGWGAPSREEGDEQVPGFQQSTVRCRPPRGRRVSGCDWLRGSPSSFIPSADWAASPWWWARVWLGQNATLMMIRGQAGHNHNIMTVSRAKIKRLTPTKNWHESKSKKQTNKKTQQQPWNWIRHRHIIPSGFPNCVITTGACD